MKSIRQKKKENLKSNNNVYFLMHKSHCTNLWVGNVVIKALNLMRLRKNELFNYFKITQPVDSRNPKLTNNNVYTHMYAYLQTCYNIIKNSSAN